VTLWARLEGREFCWVCFLVKYHGGLLTALREAAHQKDDWIDGARTEDVVAFLDRLYTAKRKAERRITALGGYDESVRIVTKLQRSV
jgi:hypothetical protein